MSDNPTSETTEAVVSSAGDPTVESLAAEASAWFERATRAGTEDDRYTRLQDGAPEWVSDLVYDAHADMGPDDWRYDCIESALDAIAEGDDDGHEFADGHADVYTGRGLSWLASNLQRVGYVDDAVSELGYDADRGIAGMIALGQYQEASEVFSLVYRALEDHLAGMDA